MPQSQQVNSTTLPRLWPARWLAGFRRALLSWYQIHHRPLPWRETRDPYAIWVSEVMLQQTQVTTVLRYYARFLNRFPNVMSLASADEQDVLRLWEGLGYYRRARQLHTAARKIAAEHGSLFPLEYESLRRLPGIGRYTAGAILSFAIDARRPILEANTVRLLTRLLGYQGDPSRSAGQSLLWLAAESILPRTGSGLVNQALMELGSQVCTPQNPACHQCPVASRCAANRDGLQGVIPAFRPKPAAEQTREAAVVIRHNARLLLVQRAARERWAGLWDFPRFPITATEESIIEREVIDAVARLCEVPVILRTQLATIRHSVTRFRITLRCYQADLAGRSRQKRSRRPSSAGGEQRHPFCDQRWVEPEHLPDYPLSTTGRKIARLLGATDAARRRPV